MPARIGLGPTVPDNPLGLSWHDSAWIPILNPTNVLDYFSERSNPFFDRTCNNEIVKMQRLSLDQLQNMTGLEYVLLHVQEPILYVIRKQHRHSPTQTTPLADYYIIAGVVYQAPDLASVLNSRLLSAVHHLQSSFEEASSFSRYHPSKGYSWDFKSQRPGVDKTAAGKKDTEKPREEPSSLFQRQRVDMLLGEMLKKFPLPTPAIQQKPPPPPTSTTTVTSSTNQTGTVTTTTSTTTIKQEPGTGETTTLDKDKIKTEPDTKGTGKPPEKKPRIG